MSESLETFGDLRIFPGPNPGVAIGLSLDKGLSWNGQGDWLLIRAASTTVDMAIWCSLKKIAIWQCITFVMKMLTLDRRMHFFDRMNRDSERIPRCLRRG